MQILSGLFSEPFRLIGAIRVSDVVDILIIAVAIYWLIGFIRRTNSAKVANGLVLLALALWLSGILNLSVTNYVLRKLFEIGILAVIVLFQPEIRRALEKVGSSRLNLFGENIGFSAESAILQTVFACEELS